MGFIKVLKERYGRLTNGDFKASKELDGFMKNKKGIKKYISKYTYEPSEKQTKEKKSILIEN